VFFIMISSFSFVCSDTGYMFNLFSKYMILDILCSCGWQE
jgi:hypothetical protein